MWLLVASVVALLVGPALARVAGRRRGPLAALDGFIVVALLGLVLLEVLPEAFEHAGPLAVVAAVAGLALPRLLEGRLEVAEGQLHGAVTWGAVLGYSVHAVLDGAALVGEASSPALGLGVVLHRVPVGVTMWWLVRPRYGGRGAALAVTVIGGATALGFAGAGRLVAALPLGSLGLFQALVGGSLLHVVAGHGHGAEPSDAAPRSSALGALVAVAFLVGVAHTGGEGHEHGFGELLRLATDAAPFALLGGLLALGADALARARRSRLSGRVVSEFLAFAVALGLIGVKFALARLFAVALGLAAARAVAPAADAGDAAEPCGPFDALDGAGSQVLLGATCGALVHTGLAGAPLGGLVGPIGALGLAWVLPMSGPAATLVAAALAPHAPAASLVYAAAAPLVALESSGRGDVKGRRFGSPALVATACVVLVVAAGLLVAGPGGFAGLLQPIPMAKGLPRATSQAALVALLLGLVARLASSGARAFVQGIVAPVGLGAAPTSEPHAHAHDHGEAHGHGHEHRH